MQTFTVPADIVRAALVIAPRKDVRFYLNGLYFERDRMVTTDGHRMLIARIEAPIVGPGFTIPGDAFRGITARTNTVTIEVGPETPDNQPRDVSVTADNGMSVRCKTTGGVYPDYRRIFPATASGEVAQFDPAYIGDIGRIADIVNPKRVGSNARICYNGQAHTRVTFGRDDIVMVLMPLRTDGEAYDLAEHAWVMDRAA